MIAGMLNFTGRTSAQILLFKLGIWNFLTLKVSSMTLFFWDLEMPNDVRLNMQLALTLYLWIQIECFFPLYCAIPPTEPTIWL